MLDNDLSSLKNMLHQDKLEAIIKRLTLLIKIVLIICISLSTLFFLAIILTGGQFDYDSDSLTYTDDIAIFVAFSAFYSFIWGTIPR